MTEEKKVKITAPKKSQNAQEEGTTHVRTRLLKRVIKVETKTDDESKKSQFGLKKEEKKKIKFKIRKNPPSRVTVLEDKTKPKPTPQTKKVEIKNDNRERPRNASTPNTTKKDVLPTKDVAQPEKTQVEGPRRRSFKATRRKQFITKKERELEKSLAIKNKNKIVQPANPVPKSISIMENITVSELAKKMNLKASQLLSKLMDMGVMASVNSTIDSDTVQILASEYSCEVKIVSLYDQTTIEGTKDSEENLLPRAPIITVMGHVDHGKTTLLDVIRKTSTVKNEQGSITQHIGAYQVEVANRPITFLDTPGHAAFSLMRSRGAQLTDIVVLVVAANDGIKEQTKEAITHAREAKVPIIVALNKIDLSDSNIDKVYKELSEADLVPEEWGGNTVVCKVSALKEEGIDNLLEHIILSADLLELKANPSCLAEGRIIESKISHGHGIVATVLIEKGTLSVKDPFVAGIYSGRARLLLDDNGKKIQKAGPSTPVEVIGLEGIPFAGDPFQVTESEKLAKQVAVRRQELDRHKTGENVVKITTDTLYSSIEESNINYYKVIIKGDVQGSVEAIKMSLLEIGNDEAKIQVVFAAAGSINENDVMLASASNAHIIGFNVKPSQKIQQLAQQEKVNIHRFSIIFDVIEKMKEILSGMLRPDITLEKTGEVEVRNIFTNSKTGTIAGSFVVSGKITNNSTIHIMRGEKKIAEDKVASLQRFQDVVKNVGSGYECGIILRDTNSVEVGDIFFVFEEKEVARNI